MCNVLALFLLPLSKFVKFNNLLLHIRNIFFDFIRPLWSSYYSPVKQEAKAGQFHVPSHPGVIKM